MNDHHSAMDDMADFAQGRTWAPYIPRGCDQREGAHAVDTEQQIPAEACTELGAESRRERMGRVSSWERWALTLSPGLLGSFAAVVIVSAAIWSRHV